eukprot:6201093-Pleurochrysis_carterae.AAC.1
MLNSKPHMTTAFVCLPLCATRHPCVAVPLLRSAGRGGDGCRRRGRSVDRRAGDPDDSEDLPLRR